MFDKEGKGREGSPVLWGTDQSVMKASGEIIDALVCLHRSVAGRAPDATCGEKFFATHG